ncbi:MAG: hypothetical protein IPK82_06950 [Polyangiaceae bacterium]|nr:hypothetical protein [Polyangiaceae bacterium]
MTQATQTDLKNPHIPLCFDTSAVFGKSGAPKDLGVIRKRFPTRLLIIPSIVAAERIRQLRADFGTGFNWQLIHNFLDDPKLNLQIYPFAGSTVRARRSHNERTISYWLDVVGAIDKDEWKKREKGRFADHAIFAIARESGSILVTSENQTGSGLRQQVELSGYQPGMATMQVILDACNSR